jgi:plastocyanin
MRMEIKRIAYLFFVPFAAGIVVAAAISFPVVSAQLKDTKLEVENYSFLPKSVAVKAGTTVTWTNEDNTPHTVASSTKLFKSKALDTTDSFSYTFTTPGVYQYFCSLHPFMTGTVVVEGASGSSMAP